MRVSLSKNHRGQSDLFQDCRIPIDDFLSELKFPAKFAESLGLVLLVSQNCKAMYVHENCFNKKKNL